MRREDFIEEDIDSKQAITRTHTADVEVTSSSTEERSTGLTWSISPKKQLKSTSSVNPDGNEWLAATVEGVTLAR